MCNLYSHTRPQQAVRDLAGAKRDLHSRFDELVLIHPEAPVAQKLSISGPRPDALNFPPSRVLRRGFFGKVRKN
jgi:hypothetical protein